MEAGPGDVLLQRPWLPVNIDGCRLLAKSWFGETAYHVLLTDVHGVWEEKMDAAAIQSRAQKLNKRLRAPVGAFFSHLCEVVQPLLSGGGDRHHGEGNGENGGGVQVSLARPDDGTISLKLKSELAGLPFYWDVHCTPAPVTVVCAQLVRPLLAMSHLLQRQVGQLGGLLGRKDAEILDYRENGATLSRERLQTEAFDEQTYRKDFLSKAFPLPDTLTLDADLQLLYAAVVAHGNPRKRKPEPEPEPEPEVTPSSSGESNGDAGEDETPHAVAAGDETPDRAAAQQCPASGATERASSKPKKKKVGLFR